MGVDISFVFQRRDGDKWVDVSSDFSGDRDSGLASWLGFGAGDRNGTYYLDQPIATLRGLPPDFEIVGEIRHPVPAGSHSPAMYLHSYPSDGRYEGMYLMGDRANSWLLASEILAEAPPKVVRTVRIPVHEYAQWKWWNEGRTPWQAECSNWESPVGEPDKITHGEATVDVEWLYDLAPEFCYFTDEVLRLQNEYGEIRFVFGFTG
jgi:hypothetical protein